MIAGLILAGGQGRRLGGINKGDIALGGVSLRDRVASRLAGQCDVLLVSTGFHAPPADRSLIALPDRADGIRGPCAGLLEGARWCAAHAPNVLLLSVAVDTPLFPLDFAARSRAFLGSDIGCVVAGYGGRTYPTNALWRPAHLFAHLDALAPAPHGPRVRDVQAALGVAVLDYGDLAAENPFAGINTPEDLEALGQRIAR